jgi:hypothetical protein
VRLFSFESLVAALHAAGVRYLIAGGLAVNAHGYLRFTKNVYFVVQLDIDFLRTKLDDDAHRNG